MGYNFTTTTVDLVQAKRGSHQVAPILNLRSSEAQRVRAALLVGSRLGNTTHLEEGSVQQSQNIRLSVMESPWCRSSKRFRASNDGAQVPSCLVDGCNSDLSKCKDYHRRHKVCELHSKTPKVTIRGQEQRFCQQCSRFHSLGEFDDRKRSCRKRLDGHNRRRRKAQSDPSLSSSCFRINHRGTELIRFGSPETASALASCSWAGALKPEIDSVLHSSSSSSFYQQLNFGDRKMLLSTSSPPSYKPQVQFPFMQFNKDPSSGCSVSGTSPGPSPMTGDNDGCSSQKMLPSWLFESPSNSRCALSLLSSSSVQEAAAAAQSPHHTDALTTMQFNLLECSHSSMPTLHQNRVRVSEPTSNFLSAPGSLHEMFRGGHDGSSAATGSQSHHTPSSSPPGSKHPPAPGQFSYFSSH